MFPKMSLNVRSNNVSGNITDVYVPVMSILFLTSFSQTNEGGVDQLHGLPENLADLIHG